MEKPDKKPDARVFNPHAPKIQIYVNVKYKLLLERYMEHRGYESESSAAFSIIRAALDRTFPLG